MNKKMTAAATAFARASPSAHGKNGVLWEKLGHFFLLFIPFMSTEMSTRYHFEIKINYDKMYCELCRSNSFIPLVACSL